MNENELKAAIARNGLSIPKLAKEIHIGKKALYQKVKGRSQFTQKEICSISKILHLEEEDVLQIFFAELVS